MNSTLEHIYDGKDTDCFLALLLETYAGINKATMYAEPEKTVSESVLLKINDGIKKLKKHMPIEYIIGYTDFLGLKIQVNSNVLIPRPETEELCHFLINYLKKNNNTKAPIVLDACTGSGAIALSVKKNIPEAAVYAFDNVAASVKTAVKNAEAHHLNIHFFEADLFNFNTLETINGVDVIISNPPYVRLSEKEMMQANVLDYEPHNALFVKDEEALVYYEQLARLGMLKLKKNGFLICEINEALAHDVSALLKQHAYAAVKIFSDFNGKHRFATALKK